MVVVVEETAYHGKKFEKCGWKLMVTAFGLAHRVSCQGGKVVKMRLKLVECFRAWWIIYVFFL